MGKGPHATLPHMPEKDREMFYNYLDNAKVYFEYGSGGSTYVACQKSNLQKIYSVETDKKFMEKLDKNIRDVKNGSNLVWLYVEVGAGYSQWGHPSRNVTDEACINYSNQLGNLTKEEIQKIDFILVDGRFRVASCLKCFSFIQDSCLIAFDDFIVRQETYGKVLDYYDIIEKTLDNSMVILRKKQNVKSIPLEVIKQYELDKS
tara:strand:+ start:1756 stop:2367 length:612 start_codon:yes stop_codon:yes gene_type:complete